MLNCPPPRRTTSLAFVPLLALLTTASLAAAHSNPPAELIQLATCDAEAAFTLDANDDPVPPAEMKMAIRTARALQPALTDHWSFKVEKLDAEKVGATFARASTLIDIDGPGLRLLFTVIERYLLNAKGSDGRLRPLADLLKIKEGQLRLIVNLFTQADTLFVQDRIDARWPRFLREARDPATLLLNDIAAHNPAPHVLAFVRGDLAATLGTRARYARLSLDPSGNQVILRSPVGIYKINMRQGLKDRPAVAAPVVHSTTQWGRQHDFIIHGKIDVDVTDPDASPYVRTLTRADAFLHPHLIAPTLDVFPTLTQLSPMQKDVVKSMKAEDVAAEAELEAMGLDAPVRLAYQVTTGAGKTPIGAAYIREMITDRWGNRRPRIVFVVENTQILRQAAATYARDLGIPADRIYLMFGDDGVTPLSVGAQTFDVAAGAQISPEFNWEAIFVTRTMMEKRSSWFTNELAKENRKDPAKRRPTLVFVDEAHHLEMAEGQYQKIFQKIIPKMRIEDRIIGASATFGSKKRNIVEEFFGGHIVGSHLYGEELAQLRRGEDLDTLALTQFLRCTVDGYVNPVDENSFNLVAGETTAAMLRDRLNKNNIADAELYRVVTNLIRGMRTTSQLDRWMFFEVKKERAEDGARYLQKTYGESGATYIHSGLSDQVVRERLDWMRDADRTTRHQHKALTSVGQSIEGTDIRGINGSAIMRNLGGDRIVQQVLGRSARLEAFKTTMRLADPTGRATAYLESVGDLWYRARAPRELTPAGEWHAPAPPLVVPPTKLELEAKRIEVETKLREQREQLEKRRAAEVEQLKIMVGRGGAFRLIAWDPRTRREEQFVNVGARFAQWFALFPVAAQDKHREAFEVLTWPVQPIDPARPQPSDVVAVRRGFNLLVKMYNDLGDEERHFLAPIEAGERALEAGLAPMLFRLNPDVEIAAQPNLTYRAWRSDELFSFNRRSAAGEVFSGPKAHQATLVRLLDSNAYRLIKVLPQLLATRTHLRTDIATRLLAEAFERLTEAEARQVGVQPLATLYLARLINHWLELLPAGEFKAWDLNPAFGKPPHPLLDQPSMNGFWTIFGTLDQRLGGAADASAPAVTKRRARR